MRAWLRHEDSRKKLDNSRKLLLGLERQYDSEIFHAEIDRNCPSAFQVIDGVLISKGRLGSENVTQMREAMMTLRRKHTQALRSAMLDLWPKEESSRQRHHRNCRMAEIMDSSSDAPKGQEGLLLSRLLQDTLS